MEAVPILLRPSALGVVPSKTILHPEVDVPDPPVHLHVEPGISPALPGLDGGSLGVGVVSAVVAFSPVGTVVELIADGMVGRDGKSGATNEEDDLIHVSVPRPNSLVTMERMKWCTKAVDEREKERVSASSDLCVVVWIICYV